MVFYTLWRLWRFRCRRTASSSTPASSSEASLPTLMRRRQCSHPSQFRRVPHLLLAAALLLEAKGMLLLSRSVSGLLMPFDCVKLRSANDPELSLGFDFGKTSGKCMKKPGAMLWHVLMRYSLLQCTCKLAGLSPSLACVLLQRIACVADSGRREQLLAHWEASEACETCRLVSGFAAETVFQAMLQACKQHMVDTLASVAFGQDRYCFLCGSFCSQTGFIFV